MVLIGYFKFKLEGVDKLGLFSSCEVNDHFSVELFLPTEQEFSRVLHLKSSFTSSNGFDR